VGDISKTRWRSAVMGLLFCCCCCCWLEGICVPLRGGMLVMIDLVVVVVDLMGWWWGESSCILRLEVRDRIPVCFCCCCRLVLSNDNSILPSSPPLPLPPPLGSEIALLLFCVTVRWRFGRPRLCCALQY